MDLTTINCQNDDVVINKIGKIYVINLEHSKERWEKVSESLNKIDINYERFPAIYGIDVILTDKKNGKEFSGKDLKNQVHKLELYHEYVVTCPPNQKGESVSFNFEHIELDYKFSVGYFGILCSNYYIAQEMLENRYPYMIIFEDDIHIKNDHFKEKLINYMSHLPETFDIAYLGVYNDKDQQIPVNEYVNKFAPDANWFCRMGIILSYKGAEKFLINHKFYGSLDHFIIANAGYQNIPNTNNKYLEVYVSPELQ